MNFLSNTYTFHYIEFIKKIRTQVRYGQAHVDRSLTKSMAICKLTRHGHMLDHVLRGKQFSILVILPSFFLHMSSLRLTAMRQRIVNQSTGCHHPCIEHGRKKIRPTRLCHGRSQSAIMPEKVTFQSPDLPLLMLRILKLIFLKSISLVN